MVTLNGGFSTARGDQLSADDRDLIEEFIRSKGVQQIQPAAAGSNEASRATRERVAQARREFRKAQRNKNK